MPPLVSPLPPGQQTPVEHDRVAGSVRGPGRQAGTRPWPHGMDTCPLVTSGFGLRPRACSAGRTPCHPHCMRTPGRLRPPASPRPSPTAYSRASSCHTWQPGVRAGQQLTPQTSAPLRPSPEVSRIPVTKGHGPPRARQRRLCRVPAAWEASVSGVRRERDRPCGAGGSACRRGSSAHRRPVPGSHQGRQPEPAAHSVKQGLQVTFPWWF